jgi:hypothetical protein
MSDADFQEPVWEWLEEARQQIREIAKLPQLWNSFGGPPPDSGKLEAAWQLLQRLALASGRRLPKPRVVPSVAGGVLFVWGSDDCCLNIGIESTGQPYYKWRDYEGGGKESGVISDDAWPPIVLFARQAAAKQLLGKPQR